MKRLLILMGVLVGLISCQKEKQEDLLIIDNKPNSNIVLKNTNWKYLHRTALFQDSTFEYHDSLQPSSGLINSYYFRYNVLNNRIYMTAVKSVLSGQTYISYKSSSDTLILKSDTLFIGNMIMGKQWKN